MGTRTLWKIYSRAGGSDPEDYAGECRNRGIIAIGWNEIGPLSRFKSRESIEHALVELGWYRRSERRGLASAAGVLWRFLDEVKPGHLVFCPDKNAGERVHVGLIGSGGVRHRRDPPSSLPFAHWRPVRWRRRPLTPGEKRRYMPQRGGNQTLTLLMQDAPALLMRESAAVARAKGLPRGRFSIPVEPDKVFGRAAEMRAMAWLRDRGLKPVDIAHLAKGWDISCGEEKYEVKSRKSEGTKIRLSQNEWNAACKHRQEYFLLLFTTPTLSALRQAEPERIPDPTRSAEWSERCVIEHFLESF